MSRYGRRGAQSHYSQPPPYSESAPARPPQYECFGLDHATATGCTTQLASPGLCPAHTEQGMWLHSTAARISARARRAHAEDRRCCGLTKMYALCRNNPGGNFLYCWRHGGQRAPVGVGAAPGVEAPQRAIIRERAREFERIRAQSEAGEREARERRAREEQRRREQARERAEREEEERREWHQQHQQQREEEQRRQEQERTRGSHRQQQDNSQWEWYQRQRRQRQESRNADEEWRRREQQERDRARRAQEERARRAEEERRRQGDGGAGVPRDARTHAALVQNYRAASEIFDATAFSASNPNAFARVPWPVFPRLDGSVLVGDVSPGNVRLFFDAGRLRSFKTVREIDVILKNTARRFHPDRFSGNRPVISSIRDAGERNAVLEAAAVVIRIVNECRGRS